MNNMNSSKMTCRLAAAVTGLVGLPIGLGAMMAFHALIGSRDGTTGVYALFGFLAVTFLSLWWLAAMHVSRVMAWYKHSRVVRLMAAHILSCWLVGNALAILCVGTLIPFSPVRRARVASWWHEVTSSEVVAEPMPEAK